MHQLIIEYHGGLRTKAEHLKSGNELLTDAPVDNHGRGEAFSPTDLISTAFGSCILTIMGIAAENHGIDITGTKVEVYKVMDENPRRISEINMKISFKTDLSITERNSLERAARTCPVHKSLHPEMKKEIIFHYFN